MERAEKKPVIAMSRLGKKGRLGNQLIQYAFLRTYAARHGLRVQTPKWLGTRLFGLEDEEVEKEFPLYWEVFHNDLEYAKIPKLKDPLCDVDVSGFFQYPTEYYASHRDEIRKMFTPVEPIAGELSGPLERLRARGKTVIGLHARRSNYGFCYFYRTPASWFLEWLRERWEGWEQPVLFIASDEPDAIVPEFAEFDPVTARDLGVAATDWDGYEDLYLLSKCDVLAISNSSFSFVAAMLNEGLREAWRPVLTQSVGPPPARWERFDPWDAPVLLTDVWVEDLAEPGECAFAVERRVALAAKKSFFEGCQYLEVGNARAARKCFRRCRRIGLHEEEARRMWWWSFFPGAAFAALRSRRRVRKQLDG